MTLPNTTKRLELTAMISVGVLTLGAADDIMASTGDALTLTDKATSNTITGSSPAVISTLAEITDLENLISEFTDQIENYTPIAWWLSETTTMREFAMAKKLSAIANFEQREFIYNEKLHQKISYLKHIQSILLNFGTLPPLVASTESKESSANRESAYKKLELKLKSDILCQYNQDNTKQCHQRHNENR